MRVVRTRSIPNVPTARLLDDLRFLHNTYHTPDGLSKHEGARRSLVDNGRKILAIRAELTARCETSGIPCQWCGP